MTYTKRTLAIFETIKRIVKERCIADDIFDSTLTHKPVLDVTNIYTKEIDNHDIMMEKINDYKLLLVKHRILIKELNEADCRSELFDALCLELAAIGHRIKEAKRELVFHSQK